MSLETTLPAKVQIANLFANSGPQVSSWAKLGRLVNPPISRERARVIGRILGLSLPEKNSSHLCQSCGTKVHRASNICRACNSQKRFADSSVELTCTGCGVIKRVLKSYARELERRGHKRFYHDRACFLAHGGRPPSGSVASMQTIKPGEARRIEHPDVSCISRKAQGRGSGYICTLAHAFYRTGWKGVVYHEGEHVAVVVRFPESTIIPSYAYLVNSQ